MLCRKELTEKEAAEFALRIDEDYRARVAPLSPSRPSPPAPLCALVCTESLPCRTAATLTLTLAAHTSRPRLLLRRCTG